MRRFALNRFSLECLKEEGDNTYQRSSYLEFLVCQYLRGTQYPDLQHNFNCLSQKRYDHCIPDGDSRAHKTLVFVHGCKTHGHLDARGQCCALMGKDATLDSVNPFNEDYRTSIAKFDRLQRSLLKREDVKKIHVVYECEFLKELHDPRSAVHAFFFASPLCQLQLNDGALPVPLRVRQALRGGHCENFSHYAHCYGDRGPEMKATWTGPPTTPLTYIDINSLYPYVALGDFPHGPSIHLRGHDVIKQRVVYQEGRLLFKDEAGVLHPMEGVVCGRFSHDRDRDATFNIPFLPVREAKTQKNMRAYCSVCLRRRLTRPCQHTLLEKSFIDCYTVTDLNYALSVGYVIVYYFEIIVYLQQAPLFADFMRVTAYHKIKHQEIPPGIASLDLYCQEVNSGMGFTDGCRLRPQDLSPHPVLVSFFKLILNSALGSLGKATIREERAFVSSAVDLTGYFVDDRLEVKSCHMVNEDVAEVTYEKRGTAVKNVNSSALLNCIITARARVVLHSHLMTFIKHGYTVHYIDTDSAVISQEGAKAQPLERLIRIHPTIFGAWKVETHPESYISEFASLSSKNYAIELRDKKTHAPLKSIIKVRGFSLVSRGSREKVNITKMLQFIREMQDGKPSEESVAFDNFTIRINGKKKQLNGVQVKKMYKSLKLHEVKRFLNVRRHPFKTWAYGSFESHHATLDGSGRALSMSVLAS